MKSMEFICIFLNNKETFQKETRKMLLTSSKKGKRTNQNTRIICQELIVPLLINVNQN